MTTKTKKPAHPKRAAKKPETAVLEKPKTEAKPKAAPASSYVFAVGRRKTAVATVKLYAGGDGTFTVNDRPLLNYFPTLQLQKFATDPLEITGLGKSFKVEVDARGGGIFAQAQAVALGLSRAIIKIDSGHRLVLKKQGLLRRDARKKERKKPGLKRARRAPQWQKR